MLKKLLNYIRLSFFFEMYFLGYEFCVVIFLLFRVVMMRMKNKIIFSCFLNRFVMWWSILFNE